VSGPPATPRALVWATDIDKLPPDRVVQRRDGYLMVRTPSNPPFWWGTFLLFDDPPEPGDRTRWEQLFEAEFGDEPRIEHRTFAWDRVDGEIGEAHSEFVAAGYDMEDTIGLVAAPDQIRPHPRENRDVTVRALDPAPGADRELWAQVVELQAASRDDDHPEPEDVYREFTRHRMDELRMFFRAGRGAWYVALVGEGTVAGSCGVIVTGDRGRFHAVDTAAAHRRQGICSRLVVEAAHRSAENYGAARLVIAAEADYHALGLYESLGFERAEHVHGVCQTPAARRASAGLG
jgi:ribosomal protein S18 acetylase RimI-like enzyme